MKNEYPYGEEPDKVVETSGDIEDHPEHQPPDPDGHQWVDQVPQPSQNRVPVLCLELRGGDRHRELTAVPDGTKVIPNARAHAHSGKGPDICSWDRRDGHLVTALHIIAEFERGADNGPSHVGHRTFPEVQIYVPFGGEPLGICPVDPLNSPDDV